MKNTLLAELDSCGAVITYVPLRKEVPFRDFVHLSENARIYEIQPRASLDPSAEAAAARSAAARLRTCVLLPGKQFDVSGTRHGQGGGWYDRFLSHVPADWVRIGFCFARQFSPDPLKRESWDQVMDYVCVVDEAGEMTVHETHARNVL
jgi:5-formyltetrahydrofolate cyclo-ligase